MASVKFLISASFQDIKLLVGQRLLTEGVPNYDRALELLHHLASMGLEMLRIGALNAGTPLPTWISSIVFKVFSIVRRNCSIRKKVC